jgi:uncharacterized cupredoxin-like copper-binding protein
MAPDRKPNTRRTLFAAAGATVLLAAGSAFGIAAATGGFASGCKAPTLPGTVVSVTEFDMRHMEMSMMGGYSGGMRLVATPTAAPAGTISFLVHNRGGLTHELVVLPLRAGSTPGSRAVGTDQRISEASSVGEASRSCDDGEGEGIHPGSRGWVTLHLTPGRYELVCNLPNHYGNGMYAELDIT